MSYFLILLAVLLLAVFQTTLLGLNLLFVLVLLLGLFLSFNSAFVWAFLIGLIFSLFTASPLGYASLGFLFILLMMTMIKENFSLENPLSCFIFCLISYGIFTFITRFPIRILEGILLSVIIVVICLWRKPALGVKK